MLVRLGELDPPAVQNIHGSQHPKTPWQVRYLRFYLGLSHQQAMTRSGPGTGAQIAANHTRDYSCTKQKRATPLAAALRLACDNTICTLVALPRYPTGFAPCCCCHHLRCQQVPFLPSVCFVSHVAGRSQTGCSAASLREGQRESKGKGQNREARKTAEIEVDMIKPCINGVVVAPNDSFCRGGLRREGNRSGLETTTTGGLDHETRKPM